MLVIPSDMNKMPVPTKLPDIQLVESIFEYDPNSGKLYRKKTGTAVGNNDRTTGFCKIRVGRLTTQVARIAWLLFYREDPVGYRIEHIDGCKTNNVITNLRKVKIRKRRKTVKL